MERSADNREVLRSNRSGPIAFSKKQPEKYHTRKFDKTDFVKFLKLQKSLTDKTIRDHLFVIQAFLVSGLPVDDFLLEIKETKSVSSYRNYVGTIKIYFRDYLKQPDMVSGYKLPSRPYRPKILPSKAELRKFYNALPSPRYKAVFLLLASSGLRISELLSAEIDRKNRMLLPASHSGKTKNSWVSFYNKEAQSLIKEFVPMRRDTIYHTFQHVSKKCGVNVNPHILRSVFAREMGLRGVQDRYIDAFCGRVPGSILARHYSDFSPEALKKVYDKANLRYFS